MLPPRPRLLLACLVAFVTACPATVSAQAPPEQVQAAAEARLRGARSSLDELEALLEDLRRDAADAGEPTPTDPDGHPIDGLAAPIRVQRQTLAALETRLESDPEGVFREAGAVVRWTATAAAPWYRQLQQRRRAAVERLRPEAAAAWEGLADLDHGTDNRFFGGTALLLRQADAAREDGDLLAARERYEQALRQCDDLRRQAALRVEVRELRKAAEESRALAAAVGPEKATPVLWKEAERAFRDTETAFKTHRLDAARKGYLQAAADYDQLRRSVLALARLDQAQQAYGGLVRGLTEDDFDRLGPVDGRVKELVLTARDEGVGPEQRTAALRRAFALLQPVVLAYRMDRAGALLADDEAVPALDHLGEVLRQQPSNALARRLFNDTVATHPDWWFRPARAESFGVTEPERRLALYELLSRSREAAGDRGGAGQARRAAAAVVAQVARDKGRLTAGLELMGHCAGAGDRASVRTVVAAVEGLVDDTAAATTQGDLLAVASGWAAASGDTATAERLIGDALRLAPAQRARSTVLAAVAAGRPETAAAPWQEMARAVGAAKGADADRVAGLGLLILRAFLDRGDAADAVAVRDAVAELLAQVNDGPVRSALAQQFLTADVRLGNWDAAWERIGDATDAGLLDELAQAAARSGDAAAALRLLDAIGGRGSERTCWVVFGVRARSAAGDWAALLTDIFELPEPAGRCAAFLGVAAGARAR